MNSKIQSYLRKALDDQRGQVIAWVALGMVTFLGMAGLSIDVGHAYVVRSQLQNSTNAAALAGAALLPNTTATSTATSYSSASGGANANNGIGATTTNASYVCIQTLVNEGLACQTPANSPTGANAIRVTQTVSVQTYFMRALGFSSIPVAAEATAAMAGGSQQPYNVAIVLDTTASMASKDSGLQCTGTQISCALQGVQTLLQEMDPCAVNTTCVSQGSSNPLMVQGAVDSVSLFAFPAMTTATKSKDYVCNTSNPAIIPYTFPTVTTTGTGQTLTLPTTATYQVVPYSSNYRPDDGLTTPLTPGSQIVIAGGGGACSGIQAPGGEGTYYAQAIYAAQASLVAQQTAGVQNAMIIITDGDATACNTATSTGNDCSGSGTSQILATSGTLNGTGSGTNKTSVTYPSALGECGQAVAAAQAATAAGTLVFTIGYGSPTSGCTTDSKYSATISGSGGGGNWGPGNSPCQALQAMASSGAQFYSDGADGCSSPQHVGFTKITQIFKAITASLTNPRLVPNSLT